MNSKNSVSVDDSQNNDIQNTELFYEYSKLIYDEQGKDIDNLNQRLTTILGFSGLLLRFCLDLPDGCLSSRIFKVSATILAAAAVFISCTGLLANPVGDVLVPRLIMSKYFDEQTVDIKADIGQTLCDSIDDFQASTGKKRKRLNRAIRVVTASAVISGIDGVLAAFLHSECIWPK